MYIKVDQTFHQSITPYLKLSLLNENKSTEVDHLLAMFNARGKNESAPGFFKKKKNKIR